jgi:drug/metabolite transporter (DMT)-like permease
MTPTARTARLWPYAVLVLCAALWSLNGPLIKLLQSPDLGGAPVSGVTIACYRSLLGGLVFIPWALRRRRTLRNVAAGWPVAGVLLFTLMTVTFVVATTRTAAANAIVLQYTSPLWVFLLSPWLLGERPRRTEALVLSIAMVGVAVIFAGNPVTEVRWLAVALTSGFGYGALTVVLRGLRPVDPLVVACLNAIGSGLLLLPAVAAWGAFGLSPLQWLVVSLMALVQFTAPYVLFSWALQRVEAHRAALVVLLETILNPLWTFLLVGEAVPAATLAGGPLILLGVGTWLILSQRRATPPAVPPGP